MRTYRVPKSEVCPDGYVDVYTKEEADNLGIEYIRYAFWKSADVGDRVETTDGWITIIIKRNDDCDPSYVRTPTGTFAIGRKSTIFDMHEFPNKYCFTRRRRGAGNYLTRQQKICFDVFEKTLDINKAIKIAYPNRKTKFHMDLKRMEILGSEKFKRIIVSKYKEIAKDHNIDEDYLVSKAKQFLERGQVGDRVELLRMLAALIGKPDLFNEQPNRLPPERVQPMFDGIQDADVVAPPKLGPVKQRESVN